MAPVPAVRGARRGDVVSEPVTCPECGGSGVERYGPLTVACHRCLGHGQVGGEREPAGKTKRPAGYGAPVWEDPAVAGLPGCRICLGAGTVTHLAGNALAVKPCPACGNPADSE